MLGVWIAAARTESLLAHYWGLSESRYSGRRNWFRRSPALFTFAALTCGFLTYLIVWFTLDALRAGGGITGRLFYQAALLASLRLTGVASMLIGAGWLLGRHYWAIERALGFLETETRRAAACQCDDTLAVAPVCEASVLLSLLRHLLRSAVAPLLLIACGMSAASVSAAQLTVSAASAAAGAEPPIWALLHFVLTGAWLLASGLLALAIHVLLCTGLGLSRQAGLLPGLSAGVFTSFQALASLSGVTCNEYFLEDGSGGLPVAQTAFWVTVISGLLLLYLARRSDPLRRVMAYGYPWLLAALWFSMLFLLINDTPFIDDWSTYLAFFACVFRPLLVLDTVGAWYFSGLPFTDHPAVVAQAGLLTLLSLMTQLILLGLAGEFARDALKRRKWGLGAP